MRVVAADVQQEAKRQEICFEMLRALHRLTLKSKIFHLSVGAAAIGKRASVSIITSCLLPLPLLINARGSGDGSVCQLVLKPIHYSL